MKFLVQKEAILGFNEFINSSFAFQLLLQMRDSSSMIIIELINDETTTKHSKSNKHFPPMPTPKTPASEIEKIY